MDSGTALKIPIVEDYNGCTAVDYALGSSRQDDYGGIFFVNSRITKSVQESINIPLAAIIFEKIQDHGFMSLGTSLIDSICLAVAKDVPAIGDFIDSRFK